MILAAVVTLAAVLAIPAAAGAQPLPGSNVVIDGPSPDIVAFSGISVARDGTGAVVYVKNVTGVAHVFVSRLIGGAFLAPEQLDSSLLGASSQPVIAAGNGGVLLVGFINAGTLYVAERLGMSASWSGPQALATGAANPAISMSNFGKAYLAFTMAGDGGHDVRAAFFKAGQWSLEPAPFDAVSGDDAGTGTGRPAVVTAGDGTGIVAWGEAGHVFTRRLRGTSPSTVVEQADVPSIGGWSEVSADAPSISSGGDSSYAPVAFRELLTDGSVQQSRVLMRRLHGSQFDPVKGADGLTTPGSDGAGQPQVVTGEYGGGFVTSSRLASPQVMAMTLGGNGSTGRVGQVDSLPNASAPDAVPAMAGLYSDIIAWQHDPGGGQPPEIRARYAQNSSTTATLLGPELVLSNPALGPTDGDVGLAAAGDIAGDAIVAWVQGPDAARQIVAEQLYQAPGGFSAATAFRYARSAQPLLAWSTPIERWGPLRYTVMVDGVPAAQVSGTAFVPAVPLPQGPHSWQVVATNPGGVTSTTRVASVWVDSVPPVALQFSLSGRAQVGSRLRVWVSYTDSAPPETPGTGSGVSDVRVNWGDGTIVHTLHSSSHVYKRGRRYTVSVRLTDRAGNLTVVTKTITVKRKPKPKKHKPKTHKTTVKLRHPQPAA